MSAARRDQMVGLDWSFRFFFRCNIYIYVYIWNRKRTCFLLKWVMSFVADDLFYFSVTLQLTSIKYSLNLENRCSQEFLALSKRFLAAVSRFDAAYIFFEYLSLVYSRLLAQQSITCCILFLKVVVALVASSTWSSRRFRRTIPIWPD